MGDVTLNDVVRITCQFVFDGVAVQQHVYYAQMQSDDLVSDLLYMGRMSDELDNIYTLINNDIYDGVTYDKLIYYHVTEDRPMGETAWPVLTVGMDAANPLPAQMCAQINFPTGIKKSMGRKYIGGLTTSAESSGGIIDPTLKATLDSFGIQLITGFSVEGATVFLGHISATAPTFRTWTSMHVANLLATQRRRKLNVGI